MHKVDFFQFSTEIIKKINHQISWWKQKKYSLVKKFHKEHVGSSFCIFIMGAIEGQLELPSVTLIQLLAKAGTS